jgi:hypothetical protein
VFYPSEKRTILLTLLFSQDLLQIIGPALSRTFINDGQPIKNKLLLSIWALSTRESFREVANRFGFRSRSKTYIFSFLHNFLRKTVLIRYKKYVFIFQVLRIICLSKFEKLFLKILISLFNGHSQRNMLIWLDLMASLIRLVLIGIFFSLSLTNIFS